LPGRVWIGNGARLAIAATLGVATVLLPAVASSETTPSISAENGPGVYEHRWEPSSVSVGQGGTVQISNSTSVPHGVHWLTGPGTPECSSGVPVGTTEAASGTNWSGTCTFAAAGTYTFDCTVHGSAMKGSIAVNGEGVPTVSTATGTTTTGTPPPTTSTGTASPPLQPAPSSPRRLNATPLAHGAHIGVTIDLGSQEAGSRLEISAFVSRTALGRRRGPASVRVGHAVESSLPQGVSHFTLKLSPAARHALRQRSRLRITVKLLIVAPDGASATATRTLTLTLRR
jgi:plastocyanin